MPATPPSLPVVALNGPTASGKSSLAVDVALLLAAAGQPAEIVNAGAAVAKAGAGALIASGWIKPILFIVISPVLGMGLALGLTVALGVAIRLGLADAEPVGLADHRRHGVALGSPRLTDPQLQVVAIQTT